MNPHSARQAEGCLGADLLLRCHRGHATPEERAAVDRHVAGCSRCRADWRSLEFLSVELLVNDADRRALARYAANPEQPWLCYRLTRDGLRELARSEEPPGDPEVYGHLESCAFCRQRLVAEAAALEGEGDTLRERLARALLAEPLAQAEAAMLRAAVWRRAADAAGALVQRAIEGIRVWVDRQRQAWAGGLVPFMPPAVAVARAMSGAERARGGPGGETPPGAIECHEPAWELPVPEWDCALAIRLVGPAPGQTAWRLECHAVGERGPHVQEHASIRIQHEGGSTIAEQRLAEYAAHPVALREGAWRVSLTFEGDEREVPIEIGGGQA